MSTNRMPQPEAWLEQYGDLLYRQAYLRMGRRELAEDIVQDTLLAALQSFASFRGDSSVETWLVGILKNKCIDHLRKNTREQVYDGDSVSEMVDRHFGSFGLWSHWIVPWRRDPEEQLRDKGFMSSLSSCIQHLPGTYRQVIVLRLIDQMDGQKVCESLKITSANLWVMLYRGRMMLRDCLDKNWFKAGEGKHVS